MLNLKFVKILRQELESNLITNLLKLVGRHRIIQLQIFQAFGRLVDTGHVLNLVDGGNLKKVVVFIFKLS